MKPILIVSQNPSARRTGESYVWGGLDKLFRFNSELRNMLDNVFITNIVKCSGKVSREIAQTCGEWLKQEIEIIRPSRIIALGWLANWWLKANRFSFIGLVWLDLLT